jgi:hypothetical protein
MQVPAPQSAVIRDDSLDESAFGDAEDDVVAAGTRRRDPSQSRVRRTHQPVMRPTASITGQPGRVGRPCEEERQRFTDELGHENYCTYVHIFTQAPGASPGTPGRCAIPAPQIPAPQIPAPQIPAPQIPAPQIPAPQIPAPQAERWRLTEAVTSP